MLCFSSVPLFLKYFTRSLDAYTQNSYRYTVAACVWLPAVLLGLRRGLLKRNVLVRLLAPAAINTVMQTFWASSIYYLEPGMMNLLVQFNVIPSTLLGICLFKEERGLLGSKRYWLGVAMCLSGVVMTLVFKQGFRSDATMRGFGLIMGAAVFWALYLVSVRANVRGRSTILTFGVIAVYTAVGCNLIAVFFGSPSRILSLQPHMHLLVIASALTGIAIAHVCYYRAIARIGVAICAGAYLANPFITALLSRSIYGEHLAALQWVGGAILVSGAALLLWAQNKLRKAET